MYRRCDKSAKKSCAVAKKPDDLAQVVDSLGIREGCARHIDCGEATPCVEEAVAACAVAELAGDLAQVIDAADQRNLARHLDVG